MKILSFGVAKDITGDLLGDFDVAQYPLTVAELKTQLFKRYPALKNLPSLAVAVNSSYANDETMVNIGDEVALIPPVSGG